jgi:hypothetical protein
LKRQYDDYRVYYIIINKSYIHIYNYILMMYILLILILLCLFTIIFEILYTIKLIIKDEIQILYDIVNNNNICE